MKRIIGLAAKARSGKDTAAAILLQHACVTAFALADPLKRGCQILFNLSDAQAWDDSVKEVEVGAWGLSPRAFFQRIGTEWMRSHNANHWLMRADREIYKPIAIHPLSSEQTNHPETPFILAAKAFFNLSDDQCWRAAAFNKIDSFWQMAPVEMVNLVKMRALQDFPDFAEKRSAMPPQEVNNTAYIQKPNLDSNGKDIIIIKDIRFENEAAYIRSIGGSIWHIVREDAQPVNMHSSEFGITVEDEDIVIHNNGTLEELGTRLNETWASLISDSADRG